MIETTTDDYECTRLGRSEVCGKVKPAVRPCAAVNFRALVFKESWLRAFARATQWQEVRTSTVDRRPSQVDCRSVRVTPKPLLATNGRVAGSHFISSVFFLSEIFYNYLLLMILPFID